MAYTRQSDTTFRFTANLPRDPATGARRQAVHRWHGSPRDVERAHAAWLLTVKPDDALTPPSSAPCSVLFDRVAEHWATHLTSHTCVLYAGIVANHLLPAFGHIPLADLRPSHMEAFYRSSLGAFEASTIRSWHTVMASALTQAVRWEWIDRSPASSAMVPPVRRKKPVATDTATVVAFLDWLATNNPELHVAVELIASTGARPAEVCALQWRHVDWSRSKLLIEQSVERGKIRRVKSTKTANSRLISLDPELVDLLAPRKDAHDLFIVATHLDPTHQIPESPVILGQRIADARDKAGVGPITSRGLRHYVATRLISAGVDPRTVAGRLGHSSPMTTLNVYADWVEERDEDAAALLRSLRGQP